MKRILRWLPVVALMAAIFAFSSIPSDEMPRFGIIDFLVKKGGHALGYALLALAIQFGMTGRPGRDLRHYLLPWLLAVLYSATDEFHQSFVPGRHATPTDVLVFDNSGAAVAMCIRWWLAKKE
jgi:VanZ family protein